MPIESSALTVIVDTSVPAAKTITGDIGSLDMSTPRASQDISGVGATAIVRLQLLTDRSVTFNGFFNDASDQEHDVFKSQPNSSVIRTVSVAHSGQTLASEMFLTDYQLARAPDGAVTIVVPAVLGDGTQPAWS